MEFTYFIKYYNLMYSVIYARVYDSIILILFESTRAEEETVLQLISFNLPAQSNKRPCKALRFEYAVTFTFCKSTFEYMNERMA